MLEPAPADRHRQAEPRGGGAVGRLQLGDERPLVGELIAAEDVRRSRVGDRAVAVAGADDHPVVVDVDRLAEQIGRGGVGCDDPPVDRRRRCVERVRRTGGRAEPGVVTGRTDEHEVAADADGGTEPVAEDAVGHGCVRRRERVEGHPGGAIEAERERLACGRTAVRCADHGQAVVDSDRGAELGAVARTGRVADGLGERRGGPVDVVEVGEPGTGEPRVVLARRADDQRRPVERDGGSEQVAEATAARWDRVALEPGTAAALEDIGCAGVRVGVIVERRADHERVAAERQRSAELVAAGDAGGRECAFGCPRRTGSLVGVDGAADAASRRADCEQRAIEVDGGTEPLGRRAVGELGLRRPGRARPGPDVDAVRPRSDCDRVAGHGHVVAIAVVGEREVGIEELLLELPRRPVVHVDERRAPAAGDAAGDVGDADHGGVAVDVDGEPVLVVVVGHDDQLVGDARVGGQPGVDRALLVRAVAWRTDGEVEPGDRDGGAIPVTGRTVAGGRRRPLHAPRRTPGTFEDVRLAGSAVLALGTDDREVADRVDGDAEPAGGLGRRAGEVEPLGPGVAHAGEDVGRAGTDRCAVVLVGRADEDGPAAGGDVPAERVAAVGRRPGEHGLLGERVARPDEHVRLALADRAGVRGADDAGGAPDRDREAEEVVRGGVGGGELVDRRSPRRQVRRAVEPVDRAGIGRGCVVLGRADPQHGVGGVERRPEPVERLRVGDVLGDDVGLDPRTRAALAVDEDGAGIGAGGRAQWSTDEDGVVVDRDGGAELARIHVEARQRRLEVPP